MRKKGQNFPYVTHGTANDGKHVRTFGVAIRCALSPHHARALNEKKKMKKRIIKTRNIIKTEEEEEEEEDDDDDDDNEDEK